MKTSILLLFFTILTMDSCHSQSVEKNIVLINVGNSDKGRIAEGIAIVNKLNPKVISLDVAFPEYLGNSDDKRLLLALRDCKKLVMPSEIYSLGEDYYGVEIISTASTYAMQFFPKHGKAGFVSVKRDKDDIQIPKQFIVWLNHSGYDYYHFSVVTAMAFDSLKALTFIQGHDSLVNVDYKNGTRKFKTFSVTEVLNGKLTKKDIEGKIVMLGFLGPGNGDKFFTPLNTNPSEPDMYGMEYLANIVSQILEYNMG